MIQAVESISRAPAAPASVEPADAGAFADVLRAESAKPAEAQKPAHKSAASDATAHDAPGSDADETGAPDHPAPGGEDEGSVAPDSGERPREAEAVDEHPAKDAGAESAAADRPARTAVVELASVRLATPRPTARVLPEAKPAAPRPELQPQPTRASHDQRPVRAHEGEVPRPRTAHTSTRDAGADDADAGQPSGSQVHEPVDPASDSGDAEATPVQQRAAASIRAVLHHASPSSEQHVRTNDPAGHTATPKRAEGGAGSEHDPRARGDKRTEELPRPVGQKDHPGVFRVVDDQSGQGAVKQVGAMAHRLATHQPGVRGGDGAEAQQPPVIAQSVRGLSAVLQQGGGTLMMKLSPATLGSLTLHLELAGTQVVVQIEAATVRAHELLTENMGVLRSALESKGLAVERMHIGLAPDAAKADAGQPAAEQHRSAQREDPDPDQDGRDAEREGKDPGHGAMDGGDQHGEEPDDGSGFGDSVRLALDTRA